MVERAAKFKSNGLLSRGSSVIQADASGVFVPHAFGGSKADNAVGRCKFLSDVGYATLRFDMRGC